MGRTLLVIAALLTASPAHAVLSLRFDNEDPIVVPLLVEGLVGIEIGFEGSSLRCECVEPSEREGGGLGYVFGLTYDKSLRENLALRIGGRFGQKSMSYAVDEVDVALDFTEARLTAGPMIYLTPWDYLTVVFGVGAFVSVFFDVDAEIDGVRRAAYSDNDRYARGEAGLNGALLLMFSPGRGRHWAWSLGMRIDVGFTDLGDLPLVVPPTSDEPLTTLSISLAAGVHF